MAQGALRKGARPSFPTLGGLVVPVPIRFYNTLGKGVGTMDGWMGRDGLESVRHW